MIELKNWKEVSKGLYQYRISDDSIYEIQIVYWDKSTDILSANASLFFIGDWYSLDGTCFTSRACLLENSPLSACIAKALEDYNKI